MIASHDYKGAYALWGCTRRQAVHAAILFPRSCRIGDQPAAIAQNAAQYHIAKSRSCGSGVILTVDVGSNRQEKLWVQRDDLTIGFSPFPRLPGPTLTAPPD